MTEISTEIQLVREPQGEGRKPLQAAALKCSIGAALINREMNGMKVTDIAFTCYPVTNLQRARRLYEGVLGLNESRFFGHGDKGFFEYDIGSNRLGIGNGAPDWKPSPGGGSVASEVDDVAAAIARLRENGCPFRVEPLETPVCHMAIVSDPDGNSVMIHRRKS